MPRPTFWYELDNRTVTTNTAYAALSVLFSLPAFADRIEWNLVELAGNTPTVRPYAQRISDDRWIPLTDSLAPAASGAESSGIVEIPPGLYDAVAYVVSGNGGAGVDLAFNVRVNAEGA